MAQPPSPLTLHSYAPAPSTRGTPLARIDGNNLISYRNHTPPPNSRQTHPWRLLEQPDPFLVSMEAAVGGRRLRPPRRHARGAWARCSTQGGELVETTTRPWCVDDTDALSLSHLLVHRTNMEAACSVHLEAEQQQRTVPYGVIIGYTGATGLRIILGQANPKPKYN